MRTLPAFLAKGGTLLFEIGFDQYESVKGLLLGAGLQNPVQKRDLGGHIRALGARRL